MPPRKPPTSLPSAAAPDPLGDMVIVVLPSGATFRVYPQEVEWFNERSRRYQEEFEWSSISDLATLDTVLSNELLHYRYSHWLSCDRDYTGEVINNVIIGRLHTELSKEIRQHKLMCGMDRPTRDKESGADSVSAYLQMLLKSAKEFGVHRETQLDKALELLHEFFGLCATWSNAVPAERAEFGYEAEDIVRWGLDTAKPQFDEIDAYFRANVQKYFHEKL